MLGIIEACLHNPASVTTICVRRHRFLPEAPGPSSLSCRSFCRATGFCVPLFTVMLECSGSANTHRRVLFREISSSVSLVFLMRFVYFCFERSRSTRLSRWDCCEYSLGFVKYEDSSDLYICIHILLCVKFYIRLEYKIRRLQMVRRIHEIQNFCFILVWDLKRFN